MKRILLLENCGRSVMENGNGTHSFMPITKLVGVLGRAHEDSYDVRSIWDDDLPDTKEVENHLFTIYDHHAYSEDEIAAAFNFLWNHKMAAIV